MKSKMPKIIISIGLALIVFISIDLIYNYFTVERFRIIAMFKTLFLSYFLLLAIYLLLWGVSKRSDIALIIITTVLFILQLVSYLKFAYTGEPVLFTDFYFLNNAGELTGIIGSTVLGVITRKLKFILLIMVTYILICITSVKNKVHIENRKNRALLITIPLIVLIFMFLPLKGMTEFTLDSVYEFNKRVDYDRGTTKKLEYFKYGFIAGIYGDLLENRLFEPKDYNEEEVNIQLSNPVNNADDEFGTPNIIVVFAESFFDINQIEEIQFDKNVTENYQKLKKEGMLINMISPSYGGVSGNVEYEFLTGANLMFFKKAYIPSMQLYRNDSYYNRPSIINELNNNGYKTKMVNYTAATSFRVNKLYDYLGVDEKEFHTNLDDENIKGYYASDRFVIDNTIKELQNKSSSEKLFYMTISMQSHMPYLINKYKEYDIRVSSSSLPKEMQITMLSYAQGIYDMDRELGRLYDYIKNYDEPTIIVFYGDHLPYLKTTEGDNILDYLKYFNTGDDILDCYRLYNTQALILANFELKDDGTKYLSPDLLGCYIINRMNINLSNYYKWLYNIKSSLASCNWYVSADSDGNIYYTDNLPDEFKSIYNLRKNIQYKLFVK